jgi:hypothetical protein
LFFAGAGSDLAIRKRIIGCAAVCAAANEAGSLKNAFLHFLRESFVQCSLAAKLAKTKYHYEM